MSMENVKKFMELVRTEESLAKRMAALKDGLQEGEFAFKDDKEFVEKEILPLAKEYGFEFAVEDFVEFTKSQLVELSEEDLSSVSGGLITEFFLSLLAVGGINLAGNAVHAAVSSYFTGGGTSVTQSVSTTDVNKASASDTAQTEDSQQQREIGKNFKNFVSQKKKELQEKLNKFGYLSPNGRRDKVEVLVKGLGGTTPDGQTITAVYNKVNDDITFKSDKTSEKETIYDAVRTPLYAAQSKLLHQWEAIICANETQVLIGQLTNYVAGNLSMQSDFVRLQDEFKKRAPNSPAVELIGKILAKKNAQNLLGNALSIEFRYFFEKLGRGLWADKEIKELAKKVTTADAKTELANKIKEKADTIIKDKLNNQLLDGCKIEIDQTELMFNIKVHYNGFGWNNSFSVDDFISKANHLEIVNSEASKKCDEVAKKLAEYMQKQYTKITDNNELKRTIQSVLTELQNGKLNDLNLGIQIVNSDAKQVTFSSVSGGQQRNTTLTIERIADEYNKIVNMQALEATRQQNEGTISYTPFGRKIWNSIGSQAQHVLNMIKKIESKTGNLSDVKDREAFENDLKYVADRILTRGRTPYGLQGDHRTDTSIKAEELQKIQEFASKIKK